jgi:transcriptional regulator with XRE-family HTH domain
MNVSISIQKFLKKRFDNNAYNKKEFLSKSNISSSVLSKLINTSQLNPSFETILKIADYFQVSIDEVVGRNKYTMYHKSQKHIFKPMYIDDITNNLRLFIKEQLYILDMSVYDLEKNCGIGDSTIMHFIKTNSTKKSLSTPVIIALAQYFNVSIDYMIGRS